MDNQKIRKLLAEGELEEAAKLANYNSPELQEYLFSKVDENTYQYLQNLGDKITAEILNLIK